MKTPGKTTVSDSFRVPESEPQLPCFAEQYHAQDSYEAYLIQSTREIESLQE